MTDFVFVKKWPAEPVVGKSEVVILEKQSLFKNTAAHLVENIVINIFTYWEGKPDFLLLFLQLIKILFSSLT